MSKHTPGPWAWFGDPKHGGFYLATVDRGRRYVMGFERMGFNKAQPTFQVDGVMVDGRDLCRFEVSPSIVGIESAKKSGSGVYRYDITEFDHPDARLIAAAPDLLEALQAAVIAMGLEKHLVDEGAVMKQARAAIAKATA